MRGVTPRRWLQAACLLLLAGQAATQSSSPPAFSNGTPTLASAGASAVALASAGASAVAFNVALTSPGQVAFVLLPASAPAPSVSDVVNSTTSPVAGAATWCV